MDVWLPCWTARQEFHFRSTVFGWMLVGEKFKNALNCAFSGFESANPFPPQTPVTSVGCQPTAVLALKVPIPSLLNPCNLCRLPTYSRPSFESANPFPPQTPVTSVGCQPTAVLALKVPIPSLLKPL